MQELINETNYRISIYDEIILDLLELRANADYNTIKAINKKIEKYTELSDSCDNWLKEYS